MGFYIVLQKKTFSFYQDDNELYIIERWETHKKNLWFFVFAWETSIISSSDVVVIDETNSFYDSKLKRNLWRDNIYRLIRDLRLVMVVDTTFFLMTLREKFSTCRKKRRRELKKKDNDIGLRPFFVQCTARRHTAAYVVVRMLYIIRQLFPLTRFFRRRLYQTRKTAVFFPPFWLSETGPGMHTKHVKSRTHRKEVFFLTKKIAAICTKKKIWLWHWALAPFL